jgi:glutamine synthetase
MAEDLEHAVAGGKTVDQAVSDVVAKAYAENERIVFGGDGYSEEWHAEAEARGLLNLRTTPDALPQMISDTTVTTFSNYGVLNERELHSRYDVLLEQYIVFVNIEAETTADIARTMLLPAALRYLDIIDESGIESLLDDVKPIVEEFVQVINRLVEVNAVHPEGTMEEALYMRDTIIPAMNEVRRVADVLERIVADDLWPLPKYSEMLFIR